jgi:hypothetical protein
MMAGLFMDSQSWHDGHAAVNSIQHCRAGMLFAAIGELWF